MLRVKKYYSRIEHRYSVKNVIKCGKEELSQKIVRSIKLIFVIVCYILVLR